MDIVIIILILALVGIGVLIFLNGNNKNLNTKSSIVKKHEIMEQYEKELQLILNNYKDDKDKQIAQKKIFLQKCSSELSRNIFFDPSESKKLIQKLASL